MTSRTRQPKRDDDGKMSSKDAALVLLLIILCIMALTHERTTGAAAFNRVTDKNGISYYIDEKGKPMKVAAGWLG